MKKGDVIQLTVIILALITALSSLEYLIGSLIAIVYGLAAGEFIYPNYSPVIVSVLVTLLYIAICWLLLVRSREIADFIYEKTGIGSSFKIVSKPNDLLYILLVVAAFYFLLIHLPELVTGLVKAFKTKATSRLDIVENEIAVDWTATCIRTLLPAALLITARPLADYFSKNISPEPVMIGEDIDTINENNITEP